MTKFQLMEMLFNSDYKIFTLNGVTGHLSSIQREDGSGSSFNVEMWNCRTNEIVKMYVKTID